jgi:hypothetical protein
MVSISKMNFMIHKMKATPDQPAGPRLRNVSPVKSSTKFHKASNVGPPAKRKTWFNSYDEEWAAFLAENSLKKSRPGINSADPEALPRVWNIPRV